MNWLRAQPLASLLRTLTFARWLAADLARLAPTDEVDWHVDRLRDLIASHEAELQRRHELAGDVVRRSAAMVAS